MVFVPVVQFVRVIAQFQPSVANDVKRTLLILMFAYAAVFVYKFVTLTRLKLNKETVIESKARTIFAARRRNMPIEKVDSQTIQKAVDEAIENHGATKDELIPILMDVNRNIGYLPREALDKISFHLQLSKSQLFSVASFYHMLSTKPLGRHIVQFCESAPCHVAGGREVWQALVDELQLGEEQTSADGKWSLLTTSCLGICGVGPVMIIDDDVYGNVDPKSVPDILARYQ